MTNPAEELLEIIILMDQMTGNINRIDKQINNKTFMAECFGVQSYSVEYLYLINALVEKTRHVRSIIEISGYPSSWIELALRSLSEIEDFFVYASKEVSKKSNPSLLLDHAKIVKEMSVIVSRKVQYPKVSISQSKFILEELESLLNWLNQQQLNEQDFIRQALIEGLEKVKFRLKHFRWLGWGYVVSSLKDVILAYEALEFRVDSPILNSSDEISSAVAIKTRKYLVKLYTGFKIAKDVSEVAGFVGKYYDSAAKLAAGSGVVVGLLSYWR